MRFLGEALIGSGARSEGIAIYREALEVDSNCIPALADLAWVLSTDPDPALRDGVTAVSLAEHAATLEAPAARTLDALAASYAETGKFAKAAEVARSALETAHAAGEESTARQIEQRLRLYEAGVPYREGPARRPEGGN